MKGRGAEVVVATVCTCLRFIADCLARTIRVLLDYRVGRARHHEVDGLGLDEREIASVAEQVMPETQVLNLPGDQVAGAACEGAGRPTGSGRAYEKRRGGRPSKRGTTVAGGSPAGVGAVMT